jgi:hypothetical protein
MAQFLRQAPDRLHGFRPGSLFREIREFLYFHHLIHFGNRTEILSVIVHFCPPPRNHQSRGTARVCIKNDRTRPGNRPVRVRQ